MDNKRVYWVMDIETMVDCIVFVFTDYHSDDSVEFIINRTHNDISKLISFLQKNVKNKDWHFGFNNLAFDAQIIEYIIKNSGFFITLSAKELSSAIYEYAQYIIALKNNNEFLDYPEWKLSIPVLDVYKINHWDNANKRCSLKWLEYSMDWDNIEEMPYHHTMPVKTDAILNEIVSYCHNDVKSTKRAFELSKAKINLRATMNAKYNLKCQNFSDTKIGSELLLNLYCKKTGKDKRIVKKLRTDVPSIDCSKIIFPYIKFKTTPFKNLLEKLNKLTIYNTKGDFNEQVTFERYHFNYGLGGIHQCIEKGVYEEDNEYVIIDADVMGMYPSIEIANKMFPTHLGYEFTEVLRDEIVNVRAKEKVKPKAERDSSIIEGFKESANASYGNSNSKYSWLFDRKYTMETTVNGQLMLSMLAEDIITTIDDTLLLQTNTDGMTFKIKKVDIDKYFEICKNWEKTTGLVLEYDYYSKMVISDVNTYLAIYKETGAVKCKGRFSWEEFTQYNIRFLHKNKSNLVVAKAIYEYFVNGVEPEEYIKTNRNIYDYCAGIKLKGKWFFVEEKVVNGEIVKTKHKKVIRYYMAKKGCKIIKENPEGKRISTESNKHMQVIMNKFVDLPWEEYNIDLTYYINKIKNEIYAIKEENSDNSIQLTLKF